jgi:hypothetical protein
VKRLPTTFRLNNQKKQTFICIPNVNGKYDTMCEESESEESESEESESEESEESKESKSEEY